MLWLVITREHFSSHASHVDASKVDINITAVGTNIASYVGGTTALQMSS